MPSKAEHSRGKVTLLAIVGVIVALSLLIFLIKTVPRSVRDALEPSPEDYSGWSVEEIVLSSNPFWGLLVQKGERIEKLGVTFETYMAFKDRENQEITESDVLELREITTKYIGWTVTKLIPLTTGKDYAIIQHPEEEGKYQVTYQDVLQLKVGGKVERRE